MNYKIAEIEGIDLIHAQKLAEVGITTLNQLLEKGSSLQGIEDLVAVTDIDHSLILEWVTMADLYRIKGVAGENSKLLAAVGVHTVKELKAQFPETLHSKMMKINRQQKLVKQLPSLGMVRSWVAQAINYQQSAPENSVSKIPDKPSKWSLDWSD